LQGLVAEPCSVSVDTGRCINDITLRVLPSDTAINCQLLYNTEIFSEKNISRLIDSFLHVLGTALKNPEAPSIDVLGRNHLIELQTLSIGEERPEYLEQPLVHEAFEAMAEQSPERKCLCFENEWLSYGAVDASASVLAEQMVEFGVGPGVVVGLMLDRSFELIISMLAVLKAGGCFLPCDPSYPDDRLAIYLEDGKALVVLAQAQHVDRATSMVASDVHVVNADDVCASLNKIVKPIPAANGNGITGKSLKNPAKLADPAYILFTSGSTGRPKGVVINHAALVDFLAYNIEYYSVDKNSVSLLSITINFDPCIMQIFTPLIVGGGLLIARPGGHMDADYLANLLLNHSVTFFNTVPSLGLEYYRRPAVKDCVALKSAIFSGEAMPMELVHLIHRNVPTGVSVYNAYGKKQLFKLYFLTTNG
jgi:non-ribosomal peptide synthetase component F